MKIKVMSEDERPRERLLKHGVSSLSTVELLALILGSGGVNKSVVDLAREIMLRSENDLNVLARMDVREMVAKYRGVGTAKASAMVAAFELGRRRRSSEECMSKIICCSRDAYNNIFAEINDLDHEEFWVIYLNNANKILAKEQLSIGGLTCTVTDIRLIFKIALELKAHSILLAHNHPSGLLSASVPDRMITQKIKSAGELLDIRLYDHIIVGNGKYLSFADEGIL